MLVRKLAGTVAVISLLVGASVAYADNSKSSQSSQSSQSGRRLYKWTDAQGVSHYGDQIPPEYANQEHEVFNAKGIQVEHLDAPKSAEQAAIDDQQKAAAADQKNRDKNLLTTYSSVQEIERLRDQRLALLSDQMRVTSQFLDLLNGRMLKLEKTTLLYKPYNADPQATQMPDQIAEDLVHMANDIRTQEQNLLEKKHEDAIMRAQFDSDISRFKELKVIH